MEAIRILVKKNYGDEVIRAISYSVKQVDFVGHFFKKIYLPPTSIYIPHNAVAKTFSKSN